MQKTARANPYDQPHLYDQAFGSEWREEMAFLILCFEQYAAVNVHRVFEPACGTGRLLFRLARAGYEVSGLDLNERAVAYCNERLRRKGFHATALIGDMTDFRLPRKVDAAFNLVSSFRHLNSESAAKLHLRRMAAALRPGGIYAVGLHLTPTGRAPCDVEVWTARRGRSRVRTRVSTTSRNLRRRQERIRITFATHTPTSTGQLESRIMLRTYTARQFCSLLSSVNAFEIVAIHDFRYQIDTPITLGSRTEDAVFVLRRRPNANH
jgi:SAM-dependent methyltransferase